MAAAADTFSSHPPSPTMFWLLTFLTTLPLLVGSSGKKLTFLGVVLPGVGRSPPTPAAYLADSSADAFRGLSFGGLNPAYLARSCSPFSTICDAWIICSKMARVGERQALHVQEAQPVQGDSPSPRGAEEGADGTLPARRLEGTTQSAKLTCGVGVLVDMLPWGYLTDRTGGAATAAGGAAGCAVGGARAWGYPGGCGWDEGGGGWVCSAPLVLPMMASTVGMSSKMDRPRW